MNASDAWMKKLPACPYENCVRLNDGWAKDKGNIDRYHKGTNECFRSYPHVQTEEGLSGQQCCYHYNGNLITEGSGAGTPDKESAFDGEDFDHVMTFRYSCVFVHLIKDVQLWEHATAEQTVAGYSTI